VRRALSPETEKGEAVLRSALLTDSGAFRWSRLNEVLSQLESLSQKPAEGAEGAEEGAAAPSAGAGMGTVTGLIGAPEGAALRRVAYDADSLSLAQHLTGTEGRPLRRAGVKSLATALQELHTSRKAAELAESLRTEEERASARREAARQRQAVRVIVSTHLLRLLRGGLPGIAAMTALLWVAARVGLVAAARAGVGMASVWLTARLRRRRAPPPAAAAA
jgi:hypothetical protein